MEAGGGGGGFPEIFKLCFIIFFTDNRVFVTASVCVCVNV